MPHPQRRQTRLKTLFIALAMYSKLPAPGGVGEKSPPGRCAGSRSSASSGAALLATAGSPLRRGWASARSLPPAGLLLIPIAVSGGIHLDGFCDTCDALPPTRTGRASWRF